MKVLRYLENPMAKQRWHTFEEARAEVEAFNLNKYPVPRLGLLATLQTMGPKPCPTPSWDPNTQYQVALRGSRAVIEKRLPGGEWIEASLEPPAGNV